MIRSAAGSHFASASSSRPASRSGSLQSPHKRMPLGRVVHRGYSSQYPAAHKCTTSSFCAAFQFQGLWGSTSYIL